MNIEAFKAQQAEALRLFEEGLARARKAAKDAKDEAERIANAAPKKIESRKDIAKAVKAAVLQGEKFHAEDDDIVVEVKEQPARLSLPTTRALREVFDRGQGNRAAMHALQTDGIAGLLRFWGLAADYPLHRALFNRLYKSLQSLYGKDGITQKSYDTLKPIYDDLTKK